MIILTSSFIFLRCLTGGLLRKCVPPLISCQNFSKNLTKEAIRAILGYAKKYLPRLRHYLEDDRVEIDNNQIENKIRPLALGRKNYMFAGSNKGAERAAMMYSFFASCKENDVNPRDWLKDVLLRIGNHKVNRLEELLPAQWAKSKGMDL